MRLRWALAASALVVVALLGGCTGGGSPVGPTLSAGPSGSVTSSPTATGPCATIVDHDSSLVLESLAAGQVVGVDAAVAFTLSSAACDDRPAPWPEASCDFPWNRLGEGWGRNSYGVDYGFSAQLVLGDGTSVYERFVHFRGPITLGRAYLLDQAQVCHQMPGVELNGAQVFWSPLLGGPPVTVIDELTAFQLDGPSTVVTEELVAVALQHARALDVP